MVPRPSSPVSAAPPSIISGRQNLTRGNKLRLQWVPGHAEIEGNEVADRMAKAAAADECRGDSESRRFCHGQAWPTLRGRQPRPSREERMSGLKSEPSSGVLTFPRFRKELKNEGKAVASRYYQLLTGHALIAPFLKDKLKKNRLGPMLVVRD